MENKKGFTLIELLMVVLIIGILTAVALPQYKKTVLRSKFEEYIYWTKKIYDAQQGYYLTNNSYTGDFKALSLDFPKGSSYSFNSGNGLGSVTFSDGKQFRYQTDKTTRFDFRNILFVHQYSNGSLLCYHYADKDKKALCQKLSTITCPAVGGACFIRKIF